jgi:hypothetical protein
MKTIRTLVALIVALSIAAPALAQSTPAPAPQTSVPAPSGKALIYSGAAVFAGGMATALYGFIRAGNGEFSQFGEATSRNKQLGAAGIAAAFAGGTMMFLGSRVGRYAPSAVTVSRSGLAVEKQLTW